MATQTRESRAAENTAGPTKREVSEGDVAARAYEIYMSRGGEHGRDLDDWTQAERELAARSRRDDNER